MRKLILCLVLGLFVQAQAQNYYFPPTASDQWDTAAFSDFPYDRDFTDSLYNFLDSHNSKAFIVLHKGKIVKEKYFDDFTKDSAWYWASSGKSLAAFLLGQAQHQGLIDISQSVDTYLDTGWTSCTRQQEAAIKVWHLMTMTSGLDEQVPNQNCIDPSCFHYKSSPGTRWYYYNGPYRATHKVIEAASGKSLNLFTLQNLGQPAGISGLWIDHVFYSKPRNAARFGLLMLNRGVWNGQDLIGSDSYIDSMITTSQSDNPSYGMLWWLNGKDTFKVPGFDLRFPGELIPNAPDEMFSALGKNDQKIYVIPSQDLVIVRMGDDAGQSLLGPSSFDNELWQHINRWRDVATGIHDLKQKELKLYPNPGTGTFSINQEATVLSITDIQGKTVEYARYNDTYSLAAEPGVYLVRVSYGHGMILTKRLIFR